MPVIVGSGVTLPPPTGGPPTSGPPPFDYATADWHAPDGSVWPLSNLGARYYLTEGLDGIDAAPISMAVDAHPMGGSMVRSVRSESRIITVPLFAYGLSRTEYLAVWRGLIDAFTQTSRLGPGRLRFTQPDGTAREISAWYSEGLKGKNTVQANWQLTAFSLFCEDPYFYDPAPTIIQREFAGSGSDFLAPYPTIGSSATLGRTDVLNPGGIRAWPTWHIEGPGSLLVATNHTTGKSFTLDPNADALPSPGDLIAGDVVTITTRPQSVRGPDDSIWTAALNWPGAELWPLEPGINDVEFAMTGSGAGTLVRLTFDAKFESA
jgi:hypothetical protein